MPASRQFLEFIAEQMAGIGLVTVRRMFGGAGIFCEARMIALVADDLLYLRTDAESAPDFEGKGLEPFVYRKSTKPVTMAYHRAPEECLDSADEMTYWAGKALAAARRAAAPAAGKPNRRRSGSYRTGRWRKAGT